MAYTHRVELEVGKRKDVTQNQTALATFGGSGVGVLGMKLTRDFTNRASYIRENRGSVAVNNTELQVTHIVRDVSLENPLRWIGRNVRP